MTLLLENGKEIIINAPDNGKMNGYVNRLEVNGNECTKNWLSPSALMKGAILNFEMTDIPNEKRGIHKEDFPYSLSTQE